jgi:hypothetical protein
VVRDQDGADRMTAERSRALPPRWDELLLRALVKPRDRESVSGDLLEEYRLVVRPERGHWSADAWYLSELAAVAWRAAGPWGVLLAASIVFRDTLDWWLSPTQDFYARSLVSSAIGVAMFTGSGLSIGWRSRSLRAGALAGVLTGAISAFIITAVSLGQLAAQHDTHTMRMIAASGGLEEVFVLPFLVIVPGTVCASVGAVFGKTIAVLYSRAKTKSA